MVWGSKEGHRSWFIVVKVESESSREWQGMVGVWIDREEVEVSVGVLESHDERRGSAR